MSASGGTREFGGGVITR